MPYDGSNQKQKKARAKKKGTLISYMRAKAAGTAKTNIYMNPKRMDVLKKVGN